MDGTLLEAWASQKSFQRKDAPEGPPPEDPGNPTVDFHKEKRTNETHQYDRPGRSAGPEGQRQGGQAELRRARAGRTATGWW